VGDREKARGKKERKTCITYCCWLGFIIVCGNRGRGKVRGK
jgi:hypothetical protein